MANPHDLGRKLKALRKEMGITQAEAAEAIGMARASLAGIERGHDLPGRALMAAIARFYSVSLDYLDGSSALPRDNVPLDSPQQEEEAIFLRLLRRLTPDQRQAVALMMNALLTPTDRILANHSASPPAPPNRRR